MRLAPRPLWLTLPLALFLVAAPPLAAQADAPAPVSAETETDPDPWPRVLDSEKHTLKVYPPQVESWDGRTLRARAAIEVLEKGKESPMVGAITFSARTRVDKESRLVVLDEYQSLAASFPAHPQAESKLLGFLQKQLGDRVRVVSLDRLETALAVAEEREAAAALAVRNDPPAIVFSDVPAMLVIIDGAPVWRKVDGTAFERLVNTRPLVMRGAGTHYLRLFDGWLGAPNLAGPWKVTPAPAGLQAAADASHQRQPADLLAGGAEEVDPEGRPIPKPTLAKGPVPVVVVATEPTELLVTEGAPKWQAIAGTALEFVENTTGNVFRADGKTIFALVSGRWFSAASLDGPWTFVPQSGLPADFARIPDDSPKENVKAAVAGTPQAEEARIAATIPQTAEVKRAEARFEPTIDGAPQFEPIEGTPIVYVKNSPAPILRVSDGHFYAVHNGVWFEAKAVDGPWKVAAEVPEIIYKIPTSSPLHYVTYVRVYDANDEVVVVGYTPGYYGTTITDGVVVCGTGYSYSPWIGSAYYAYPSTYGYGCGMTYSPWSGWAFTFGVGWGWGYWGSWYGPYYPPYWGGYYPWYGGAVVGPGGGWAAWGPGGWAGTTGNIYRQWGPVSSVSRYSGGFNAWTGNAWRGQVGAAYNSRTGTIAAGQRGAVGNIYSGNYAYGGRGVAAKPGSGVVGGSRVTMGNAETGREITAGRVGGYNPATGEGGSAAWARGDQGGVARVGDDFYAGKDGNIYKRNGQGDWSQVDSSGRWNGVQDRSRQQGLDRQYQARSSGSQRYQGYRSSAPRGGGMRGGGGRRR